MNGGRKMSSYAGPHTYVRNGEIRSCSSFWLECNINDIVCLGRTAGYRTDLWTYTIFLLARRAVMV